MSGRFGKQYKLLVIDIDGTLLNDQNQITQKTIDTLQQVKHLGLTIILATGRIYSDAFYFAKYLNLFSPMILLHGALIQAYNGKILKEESLSVDIVAKLIKIAREKKASFQAFQTD
ncbi:MAG: HAD family hydrolase, partial [Atribacterota bacterium]